LKIAGEWTRLKLSLSRISIAVPPRRSPNSFKAGERDGHHL
jgi:hypothetical protein